MFSAITVIFAIRIIVIVHDATVNFRESYQIEFFANRLPLWSIFSAINMFSRRSNTFLSTLNITIIFAIHFIIVVHDATVKFRYVPGFIREIFARLLQWSIFSAIKMFSRRNN